VAKAAGKKTEPGEVAGALASWVRKNIGIRRGPGLGSPTRVLAARRGNEAERVMLLGALAQTAGLAARPVWGVVRVNDRWELRNWIEIWTGHWLPLDPTVEPALDAGRIRLGIGGTGRLMDLALRGARLRFDVLEETR
jgi:transglutaminase-like putative cysteine protease